jgi:DNA repair protein RecO (recombination protein O)
MTRNSVCPALVLRVRPCGESNREAFFLTAETGITRAYVYGGAKSRLRAAVSPFHSGDLYLYRDPARDSGKVTDFDVRRWRPGIRESYDRTMAAAAIAATILAGFGGGCDWAGALARANASLDALEGADVSGVLRIFIHFLRDWAEMAGLNAGDGGAAPPVSAAVFRWLKESAALTASEAASLELDAGAAREAKDFCTGLIASAIGRRLKSWDW